MNITITQASKDFEVARSTIYKKAKNGDLSRNDDGTIDVAEMVRVFGEPKKTTPTTDNEDIENTVVDNKTTLQNQEIEFLRKQLSDKEQQLDDYKHQLNRLTDNLDKANETIQDFTKLRLIEQQQIVPIQPKKSWWKWW